MFEDATQQMSELSRPVQLWMRWLNISLLPAFFFAFDFEAARWILVGELGGSACRFAGLRGDPKHPYDGHPTYPLLDPVTRLYST